MERLEHAKKVVEKRVSWFWSNLISSHPKSWQMLMLKLTICIETCHKFERKPQSLALSSMIRSLSWRNIKLEMKSLKNAKESNEQHSHHVRASL